MVLYLELSREPHPPLVGTKLAWLSAFSWI